jgi:hypothetical protein
VRDGDRGTRATGRWAAARPSMDFPAGNGHVDAASLPGGQLAAKISQRYRHYLDKTTPHVVPRWIALAVVVLVYAVRAYLLHGYYIITYALGIYNLNLLLGFLTPQARLCATGWLTMDAGKMTRFAQAGAGRLDAE